MLLPELCFASSLSLSSLSDCVWIVRVIIVCGKCVLVLASVRNVCVCVCDDDDEDDGSPLLSLHVQPCVEHSVNLRNNLHTHTHREREQC